MPPCRARQVVKSYPVREFRGALWVFVGDMAAVPLEEDLPGMPRGDGGLVRVLDVADLSLQLAPHER